MDFLYNDELVSTQDEIKISVADLRDLIQAGELLANHSGQALNEYRMILEGILRKNRLPYGAISVDL
ncbi:MULTISPECIES: hypothetical protein [Burkholderia cepacia complex]|uniref:hypothetical protein n=1 Tax=Burkholderia cepacia complex TaxID=87882 RepID=UPI0013DDD218|nr:MULTISPECIES: hypothetical protein [Burkholderia cepacia complex]